MPKANPEAALAEFERLAAAADVNIDVSTMDQESADDVNEVRDLMTQAIGWFNHFVLGYFLALNTVYLVLLIISISGFISLVDVDHLQGVA